MNYQFHEMLDPYRHKARALNDLSRSPRLPEMLAVLQGCGYTSEEINLLRDAMQISVRTLDFERRSAPPPT